jgi:hypothetical protein
MTDSGAVAPETQTEPPGRRRGNSVAARLRALPPELRNAGIASAALVASFVLPWYQKNYSAVVANRLQAESSSLSAFGVFSFIEAAILVLSLGVLYLVWARANRRAFHLPGGDGTVIFAAGVWAILLLVWRTFDRPSAEAPGTSYGIEWGIFVAFVAAGALAAAGARIRAVDRPEPPNPVAEEDGWDVPPRGDRPADRRPADAGAVTEVLRDRPRWQGEPRPFGDEAAEAETRVEPVDPAEAETRVEPVDPAEAETRVESVDPAEARTRRAPVDPPHDRLF